MAVATGPCRQWIDTSIGLGEIPRLDLFDEKGLDRINAVVQGVEARIDVTDGKGNAVFAAP